MYTKSDLNVKKKRELKRILLVMGKLFNVFFDDDADIFRKVPSLNLTQKMFEDCCADSDDSDHDWWNNYFLCSQKMSVSQSLNTKDMLDIFVDDFEDLKVMKNTSFLSEEDDNRGKQLRSFYQRGLDHWAEQLSIESINDDGDDDETRIQSAQSVST